LAPITTKTAEEEQQHDADLDTAPHQLDAFAGPRGFVEQLLLCHVRRLRLAIGK
jgi:hypothetical protein